ncbi:MAG: hypothetical protein R2695_21275 [Acidimicrobiales bacterium]
MIVHTTDRAVLRSSQLDRLVQAHIDGAATDEERAYLADRKAAWEESLWRLLDEAEGRLDRARRNLRGAERAVVLADLDADCWRIDRALTELVGEPAEEELQPAHHEAFPEAAPEAPTGRVQLHLSRSEGRIVAWASAPAAGPSRTTRCASGSASSAAWSPTGTSRPP